MMLHYTDVAGFKAIGSQVIWTFKAAQPPGGRRFGTYFTTLRPNAHRFSARTPIPKAKQDFVFSFDGSEGLEPMDGGKGEFVFISPIDYSVSKDRQRFYGATMELP